MSALSLRVLLPLLLTTVVAIPALAQPAEAVSEDGRLAVHFSRMPDGLAVHGRFLGAHVLAVDSTLRFAVVDASHAPGFRAQAADHADVRAVEADEVLPLALLVPNDPLFATSQYGPQLIGAPAAWDLSVSPAPAICVADTGIRATHVEFTGRILAGIDLVNGDSDPADDHGHGTHVAGIAAAGTNNSLGIAGVAPSPLLVAKVLDAGGSGALSTVASGIRWCVDNGAKVVSLSLGSSSGSTALKDAVDYAWAQGAIVAAAAGNGNGCTDCVLYPARYENAIAVGCVDQYRNPCSFASTGPEVDLAAPGNAIQSTWWTGDNAYQRAGGTSMSTPHVAGAAALVWSAHPDYTNAQVRQALEASAEDVAASGRDVQTGLGLVRADLAIAAAATEPVPPEPAPVAGVLLAPAAQSAKVALRGSVTYVFNVTNTGTASDTFGLAASAVKGGWSVTMSASSLALGPGEAGQVLLVVKAPSKAGTSTVVLTVGSLADPQVSAQGTATTTTAK